MSENTKRRYSKGSQLVKTLKLVFIGFVFTNVMYSQQDDLALKAKELLYHDPSETIKIADHILKTTQDYQGRAQANLLLAISYDIKGDYINATKHAFDAENQFSEILPETRVQNLILRASLSRKLYLDKQFKDYLDSARLIVAKVSPKDEELEQQIALEQAKLLADRRDKVVFDSIQKIENDYKAFYKSNPNKKKALYLIKAQAFSNISKIDSAKVYLNKVLNLIDGAKENNLYQKAKTYAALGQLQLQEKKFKPSEETLFIALRFAEILENPNLLMQINRDLAINYLATNQNSQHKVYNDVFLVLNTEVGLMEQESVNTLFNMLTTQQESILVAEEDKYSKYFYLTLAGGLLAALLGLFLLLKSEGRKKRLKEIISYLEITKSNLIKAKLPKKKTKKRILIPEETERSLLLKLNKFEKSNKYLSKDMSLAVLAGQFETNTKYLSEIINRHYNDNFNTFINKLRINYIIEKLKSDPNYSNYKISYLAEESGYASHSSFATVFKSVVGMSPATFINLIKEERESVKDSA